MREYCFQGAWLLRAQPQRFLLARALTIMPFRLTNTPAIYQALINNILRKYLDDFIVIYLDDIFIYNKNEKKYTGYIIKVLKTLKRIGLKINGEKLIFY
jgi:Reverse transcriptase (RNA-dependent DNA polymerase)